MTVTVGTVDGGNDAPLRISPVAVALPLLALVACNVADVITTNRLLSMGAREMNPLAGWLIANNGLLLTKLFIVVVIGLAVVKAPPRRWIVPAMWAAATFYATIISFHMAQLGFA